MKSSNFLKNLRSMSYEQIVEVKTNLLREMFSLRMQMGAKQLPKNHMVGNVRRNIARVNTLASERRVFKND